MDKNTNQSLLSLTAKSHWFCTGLGMLVLAIEPLHWLIRSWFDPAIDSQGVWVFLLCLGLVVWSMSSPLLGSRPLVKGRAVQLLLLTALVRALGQTLAINVIGAMALVADVYALGLLMQLHQRKNPVSPGFLAILFAFSLPIERILQRLAGFVLQQLSADGACGVLGLFMEKVECNGVRIVLNAHDILVDLPCSGVRSLTLLGILYSAAMCLLRPGILAVSMICLLTFSGAILGNILRIVVLSLLMAYPETVGGINVLSQPWHDLIGLFSLIVAATPFAYCCLKHEPHGTLTANDHAARPVVQRQSVMDKYRLGPFFLGLSLLIVSLPRMPIDRGLPSRDLSLPIYLDRQIGMQVKLNAQEAAYFTEYGGAAIKMRYGDYSAMLIRTQSPLRHLHAPEECLRGLGFKVEYQGVHADPQPSARYVATAPDGSRWRIDVSFYSDTKEFTPHVAEAVWRWLQHPHQHWQGLQRISPLETDTAHRQRWEHALFSALDLPTQPLTGEHL